MMKSVRLVPSASLTSVPLFLAPAFADLSTTPRILQQSFSSTTINHTRQKRRDLNKRRGESVIRSTGPRHSLAAQRKFKELPRPQAEEDRPIDAFPTNPNHGLYAFFNKDKESVVPPEREELHGRAWEYHELVFKKFDDLHALYWQCLLEINRIRTRQTEHQRLKLGYGATEIRMRRDVVRGTIRNIRRVLKDRQDAYEEAKLIKEREGSMENLNSWLDEQAQLNTQPIEKDTVPRIAIVSEPNTEVPELSSSDRGTQDALLQPPRSTS